MSLFTFLLIGLIAGLLARAIFPGNQAMGWGGTLLLGLIGSFVGGGIGSFVRSDGNWLAFSPSGVLWSTVGALVVLGLTSLASRRRV
jgi:uncharacterized membrane protein YeaQ/YmgE (transglycosylase-associated protein family)